MSNKWKELYERFVYGLLLLGLGRWAFISSRGWWGLFVAVLAASIVGEVIYRLHTCYGKKIGYELHCALLVVFGVLGSWVMYSLRTTEQGTALLIFGAVMVICFDTFSYLFGWVLSRFTGGHKITPYESPNKTWEGFIGGYVSSIVAGVFTLRVVENRYVKTNIGWPLWLALALPLVAFFGDLNESMAKRRLCFHKRRDSPSIKDFSRVLGPHGGVSDRFDAMTAVFATVGLSWLLLI